MLSPGGTSMKHKACAAALALAFTGLLSWKAIATNPVLFGDPYSGISAELSDLFSEGKDEFSTVETADEGLGPVFNGDSCAGCHSTPAVGKFGWKSQNPNLLQFSGDAYVNEMGITSPMFPTENCPNGDCSQLPACYPNAGVEDDGTDVNAFADFMTLLAGPPRGAITRDALAGEKVFLRIGCGGCHLPVLVTGPSRIKAFDRVVFHPYSDFLLHDMGSLGDGIEQGKATGREMRTAPLWGLRVRTSYLHDGRALALDAAIFAHDGQGKFAKNRFSALPASDAQKLMAFLNSL